MGFCPAAESENLGTPIGKVSRMSHLLSGKLNRSIYEYPCQYEVGRSGFHDTLKIFFKSPVNEHA